MTPLAEKLRPARWEDVIGQPKAVSKLTKLRDAGGLAGRAYWISGASGTGKTTIARLIAAEVADDLCIEEIDAAGCTVSQLEEIERSSSFRALGKGGRAFIFNEAHGLRKPCIRQLLVMLERIRPHCVFIFTTTNEGQDALFEDCDDASPLLSRCLPISLTSQGLKSAFALAAVRLYRDAGILNGKPDEYYVKRAEGFLSSNKNNLRALHSAAELGYMTDRDDD